MPALLIRMSSRSTVAWVASARRRTSTSAERSAARKSAAPPLASMSATTRAPLSASRPCTSTRAPACPSLRTTSRPTPSVEPVTSAVFPLSFSIPGLLTSLRRGRLLWDAGSSKSSFSGIKNDRSWCSRAPKSEGVRLSSLKVGPAVRIPFAPAGSQQQTVSFNERNRRQRDRWFESCSLQRGVRCKPDADEGEGAWAPRQLHRSRPKITYPKIWHVRLEGSASVRVSSGPRQNIVTRYRKVSSNNGARWRGTSVTAALLGRGRRGSDLFILTVYVDEPSPFDRASVRDRLKCGERRGYPAGGELGNDPLSPRLVGCRRYNPNRTDYRGILA